MYYLLGSMTVIYEATRIITPHRPELFPLPVYSCLWTNLKLSRHKVLSISNRNEAGRRRGAEQGYLFGAVRNYDCAGKGVGG